MLANKERNAEIERLLSAGVDNAVIFKKFPAVADSTLCMFRRKLGLPALRRGRKIKPECPEAVRAMGALRSAGWTLKAIGVAFGVSSQRIDQLLNPHKNRARSYTKRLIAEGKLERSKVCENCNRETFTEAHHDDYSKPLEVRWLCQPCHAATDYGPKPTQQQAA